MRLLGLLLAVILLQYTPPAGCPPLSEAQLARIDIQVPAQAPQREFTDFDAISVEALYPYCNQRSKALMCRGGVGGKASLESVFEVDAKLRSEFEYLDDFIRVGRPDYWQDGTVCGDCEDYALTLAKRLHKKGVGGEYMWLMMWEPQPGVGHATLLVQLESDLIVEISVGQGGEPQLFNPSLGRRFAAIPLDGSQVVIPMPGYRMNGNRSAVEIAR